MPRRRVRQLLVLAAVCLPALPAVAARLPFRAYGAAEGLDGTFVRFVMQDSSGFLWVATNAGVSRFDGHEFRNYGTAEGLPFPSARKIVEMSGGSLVVLSRDKLARRDSGFSASGPEFVPVEPKALAETVGEVRDVVVAPDGSLVAVGTRGAARVSGGRVEKIDLGPTPHPDLPLAEQAWTVAFDGGGALWISRSYGITRVGSDGVPRTLILQHQAIVSGWGWLPSMVVDRAGRVWLLTVDSGAWRLESDGGIPIVAEVLDQAAGLPCRLLRTLHESPDGTIWVGSADAAVTRVERTPSGLRFVPVGPADGLLDGEVESIVTDAQGNLWAGTAEALVRLASDGLTSWRTTEGLEPAMVRAILDDPAGGVWAIVGGLDVASVRNGRVEAPWTVRGVVPGWGMQQIVAEGADRRVWVATGVGLAMYPVGTRIPDLRTRGPSRILGREDGLPGLEVHRVFAASDGSIWFGLIHSRSGVCRVEPGGSRARCFGPEDGLPDPADGAAFAEDAGGHLWAGCYSGGLARFRDGRWESWPDTAPDRQLNVQSLRRDRAGRLWAAGSPGLLRVDGAETEHPEFRRYTRENGLGSHDTLDTAEDRFGHVYVSSARGVDRIDLEGGVVRRYTPADGLPASFVSVLHADPAGDIWVGTSRGLARLVPARDETPGPPRVYVTAATVAGRRRAAATTLDLGSDERTVEFGFTSPSFRAGETMRFQWRLVGGSEEWSSPGTSRAIVLAGLAPGRYRFQVRAVDGEGLVSDPEAIAFRIRQPLWRRGWFVGFSALALGGVAAAVYHARVARLLELERVRTRIATDLHDDVGASLSQIAVLSQYASRQAARGGDEARGSLARITELSGSVVDAMSDVVWSINPARDRMSDLVRRMRRFAEDLFSESEATLTLDLPADDADERLAPEVRRQVFLVFKEALRNAVRHALASAVGVSFRHERDGLLLVVSDDGLGIAAAGASGSSTGFGLENMRRRAAAIGGMLEVSPGPAGGTEVRLRIPVSGRRYLSRWTGTTGNRAS